MSLPDPHYVAAALARRLATSQLTQPPVVLNPTNNTVQGTIRDVNGNVLVDPSGLVSAALISSIAVTPSNFTSQNYSGSASNIIVVGSVVSFTLTRAATVLVLGTLPVANDPVNTSELVGIYVDASQKVTGNISGSAAATLVYQNVTLWTVLSLSAGQHSADWRLVADSSGTTWHIGIGGKTEVFLMGS